VEGPLRRSLDQPAGQVAEHAGRCADDTRVIPSVAMPSEQDRIDQLIDGSDKTLQEARAAIKAALKQRQASRQALLNLYNKIVAMSPGDYRRHRMLNIYEKLQRKLVMQAELIVDLMGSLEHEAAEITSLAKKHPG
jgi:50S ribosomal subunit-associated GTPase HflX